MKKLLENLALAALIAAATAIGFFSCLEQGAEIENDYRTECAELSKGLKVPFYFFLFEIKSSRDFSLLLFFTFLLKHLNSSH